MLGLGVQDRVAASPGTTVRKPRNPSRTIKNPVLKLSTTHQKKIDNLYL